MTTKSAVKVLIACVLSMRAVADVPTWTPLFKGIDHAELVSSAPLVNVLRIDLHAPGIELYTTPGNGAGAYDTDTQTASDFLTSSGVQVAINGNFFVDHGGTGDLRGLAVSQGVEVSASEYVSGDTTNTFEEFLFSQANVATYKTGSATTNLTSVWTAIAGETIVHKSWAWGYEDTTEHPRTAAGLSYDGRYLYLLTADGRQSYAGTGWYEGAQRWEVAEWLVDCGAYYGLMLDGGGSTTMVKDDGVGGATLLNVPVDSDIPGQERAVGNGLGIYALPSPGTIVLGDASFEDDDVGDMVLVSNSTVSAWESINVQPAIVDDVYQWSPVNNGSAAARSGTQIGHLGGGTIYQNFTNATYEAGKTYTATYYLLSAWNGAQTSYSYFTDASEAGPNPEYGGTILDWWHNYTWTGAMVQDSWAKFTVEYVATPADVGKNVGFGIWGSGYLYIDDVSLSVAVDDPVAVMDSDFEVHMPNNTNGVDRGYDYVGNLYDWRHTVWDCPEWSYIMNATHPTNTFGPPSAHSGNQWVGLYGYTIHQALPGTYVDGYTYTMSLWATADTSNQLIYAYFTDGGGSNGYIGASNEWYLGTGSGGAEGGRIDVPDTDFAWVEHTISYTADAADAGKRIGISIFGRGETFLDDVSVSHVVPEPTALRDPGFEVYMPNNTNGVDRGYDYVGTLHDWDYTEWGSPAASLIADTTHATTTTGPPTAHDGDNWVAFNQNTIHQALPGTYVEGVTYTLSWWAAADTSNQLMYVAFTDGAGANGYIGGSNAWYIAGAGSPAIDVPDTGFAWNQYSYSFTASAADAGKRIGIDMYGRNATYIDDVSVSYVEPNAEIISIMPVAGTSAVAMEFYCPPSARATTYPLKKTDLVFGGSWIHVEHATNSAGPFTLNTLDHSSVSGGYRVIYLESIEPAAFFSFGE